MIPYPLSNWINKGSGSSRPAQVGVEPRNQPTVMAVKIRLNRMHAFGQVQPPLTSINVIAFFMLEKSKGEMDIKSRQSFA